MKLMKVICTNNLGAALSSDFMKSIIYDTPPEKHEFHVEIGRIYTVYVLSIVNGHTYFGIDVNDELGFQLLPGDLFNIVDSKVSQLWNISYEKAVGSESAYTLFGYEEATRNRGHISGLLEGVETDISIFKKYKERFDLEYPDTNVTAEAEKLDDFWLLCPDCSDAWKSHSKSALVRCPSCNSVLINPVYCEPSSD